MYGRSHYNECHNFTVHKSHVITRHEVLIETLKSVLIICVETIIKAYKTQWNNPTTYM